MTEQITDKALPKAWWAGEHWALSPDAARDLEGITTESQARIQLPGIKATDTLEAVIPIVGLLGMERWGWRMGSSYREIREAVAAAEADPRVQSIRFEIDSPGGLVKGAHETAEAIALCTKPTKSVILHRACSAAYWVGSAADEIESSPTAVIGSVGTIASFWAPEGRDEYVVDIVSSLSPRKNASVRSEDGRSQWRDVLDAQAEVFVRDVAQGRGVDYAEVLEGYGSGAILSAPAALEAGMIDSITGVTAKEAPESSGDEEMATQKTIEELQAELKAAQEQNATLKADLDAVKVKEQADELAAAKVEAEEAKAALESAQAEAAALKEQLDAAKLEVEEAKATTPEPTEAAPAADPEELAALKEQLAAAQAELATAEAAALEGDDAELIALKEQLAAAQAELSAVEGATEATPAEDGEPQAAAPPVASEEVAALKAQLEAAQAELAAAQEKAEAAAQAQIDEKAAVQAQLDEAREKLVAQKAAAAEELKTQEAAAARDLEIEKLLSRGHIAPAEKALAAHTYDTNPELFAETYGSRTAPVVALGTIHAGGGTPPPTKKMSSRERRMQWALNEAARRGMKPVGPRFVALLNSAPVGQP